MKKYSLAIFLLAGLVLLGAGCGDTTTDANVETTDGDTAVEETAGEATSDGAITVTQPVSGDTIGNSFSLKSTTTTPDKTLYIRVLDADGNPLLDAAEGDPNSETGVYDVPYVIFFGGAGADGTVEVFHKDGDTETDLVSIPVTIEE